MSLLGGWFRGAKADAAGDGHSAVDASIKERENLEDALEWTGLIMNDDIDGASKGLQQGDSTFHELGLSLTTFMRSILGFEKAIMAETSTKLAECEARAWTDFKRAQKRGPTPGGSKIYPPGTEYELVRAETQLMSAIVGVLHENLLEGMKSFYRLRKAYISLDAIITSEGKIFGLPSENGSTVLPAITHNGADTAANGAEGDKKPCEDEPSNSDSDDLADTKERPSEIPTPTNETDPSTSPGTPEPKLENLTISRPRRSSLPPIRAMPSEPNVDIDNPVDVFIHSGANMCFGLLQLMLSLVPPAFSRMLSVVGFRGDRHQGVTMLWKSAAYPNLNGAVAGMMILGFYNGLLGGVDIVPSEDDYDQDAETVGPPKEKCKQLLADMGARYPDSRLWRVEESRFLAFDKKLAEAIELLKTGPESKMKQISALNNFELSIDAMMIQDWELMRDAFLRCLEMNDWSPALYYYMGGCASLELYRDAFHKGDKDEARRQKTKAEEYLRKAPTVGGKKRLMARQLPLETFLQQKLHKWEARAKTLGLDLADAIGASPAMEMSYMWNGQKRMNAAEQQRGIGNLKWERCTASAAVVDAMKKEKDEVGVWAVCTSSHLRGLGKFNEARALLEENVLVHDKAAFKGPNRDDYVLPAATYEMGAIAWMECCAPQPAAEEDPAVYRRLKLEACQEYLDKVKAWESYTLDARIGLRVQSGLETLKWFRKKMQWTDVVAA